MSPQEEFWPAKLSVFKEMINHHIEEEEGKIFEVAEKVITDDQMENIRKNFQKEKERIKEQVAVRSQAG